MNKPKTLLQRVQSRISKRRNVIREINYEIEIIEDMRDMCFLFSPEQKEGLRECRLLAKVMGEDQQLDKQIFQVLLEQERDKYALHFRSKYPPVLHFVSKELPL